MITPAHSMEENDITMSFYRFVRIIDTDQLKIDLTNFCQGNAIIGTIVIAEEGVNGSVSGENAAIKALLSYIKKRLNIEEIISAFIQNLVFSLELTNKFFLLKRNPSKNNPIV